MIKNKEIIKNHNYQTPDHVCKYMVGLIPIGCKKILEPTPGEGNLVKALMDAGYGVKFPADDYWEMQVRPDHKIDCIVANPPFTPATYGYKFLENFMDICDKIIILMPWPTITNSDSRTQKIIEFGLTSVTHLPRRTFYGIRQNLCILKLEKNPDLKLDTRLYFY